METSEAEKEGLKRDVGLLRALLPMLEGIEYLNAGEVTDKQREIAHRSALYQRGDMRLVWMNEGDMQSAQLVAGPLRNLLNALSPSPAKQEG